MMKTNKKILHFAKIKIAKVDSTNIIGGTNPPNTIYPQCNTQPSRPPKGTRTQGTSNDGNCETDN
ncbi:MAG: hypothetical protein AAF617_16290 [Bacteroidota bacterium]